jgi:DNA-binding GntR family transcriptional regulator
MPSRSISRLPRTGKRVSPRRGGVQDAVLAQLQKGLMVGALVPGQVISLRKLAQGLGTSSMPVRQALIQLVAANVLEELPNRSVRVPRLTPGRLSELFRVREVIEGMAAKAACRKADPQLVNALDRLNRQLIKSIERHDIPGCLATNQKFHFTLYEAAESEVLMPLIAALWLQCGPTMYFSLLGPKIPWDASAHRDILTGLRRREPGLVQRALTRDIRTTAHHLLKCANDGSFHRTFGDAAGAMEIRF